MYRLKKRILLISEGRNLLDKLKILFSVLSLNNYSPEVELKNKDGVFLARGRSSDLWMLSTLGEEELREYFKLGGGVFLDIGANVGKYSVMLGNNLKGKGEVYSFEPEPLNLLSLKKNIQLNKLNNVKIIPVACSKKKGELELYIDEKNTGGHSLIKKTNQKITVKTDSVDNIVRKNKVKNIKLIKIDVEGAEMDVLIGAKETLKRDKPRIIFETDFPEDVLPYLNNLNYKIKNISSRDYFAEFLK